MGGIKVFLRKWPGLYRLLQGRYYRFRLALETHVLGSRVQEWTWRTRHLYKGSGWVREYLCSTAHPHREQVVAAIAAFSPFESILEIGCNAAPNLILLADRFPHTRLMGIDINKQAIKTGEKHLKDLGVENIKLFVGKADQLGWIKDKSIDVVFTDAVLMFVGPDKIYGLLREMERIARKGLIFNEYHSLVPPAGNYDGGRWVYNYEKLFQESFPSAKWEIRKSMFTGGGWDKYGAFMEVRL